eukprot:EG_transcript_18304
MAFTAQHMYYDAAIPEAAPQRPHSAVWYAALGFAATLALTTLAGPTAELFRPSPLRSAGMSPTLAAGLPRASMALGVGIDAADFRKGFTVEMEGAPYKVLDFQHSKQARQAAVIRTKLQNMLTGNVLEKTFRSGERLDKAEIEYSEVVFTYKDGDDFCFTNMETFVEERLPGTLLGDKVSYLSEGLGVKVAKFNGKAIDMELPTTLDVEIVDTQPGEQGDRATAGTKPATIAGGKVIQVPLFVNTGDLVRVDTRDDRYITRTK